MTQKITLSQIAKRAVTLRCPNCGGKTLFAGLLKPAEHCSLCGLALVRSPGFTLGAMIINYAILVFGVLPVLFALFYWKVLGGMQTLVIMCVVAIIGPAILYRWAWSLWLGFYYMALSHELPANRTEAIPVNDHE
ncbi:MAG: hypothetical protein B7X06_01050 [Verrucomicrobia bacterium 21-51-4]|nr:MAG: hypothetical protein B7X06_01050 [Verrucomicrobia bacterium 21-51-4]HQU08770.1 DUF983 domain-containing protein [Opitutales bacterium]